MEDLDAVLRNNFVFRDDGSRGEVVRLPGRGIHFSEFPNVALGFGNGLILCRVLPGSCHNISGKAKVFIVSQSFL